MLSVVERDRDEVDLGMLEVRHQEDLAALAVRMGPDGMAFTITGEVVEMDYPGSPVDGG